MILSRARQQAEEPNHAVRDLESKAERTEPPIKRTQNVTEVSEDPAFRRAGYFFGYPTDWEYVIRWSGRKFKALAKASRSIRARNTVPSPSDAQNK